MRKSLIVLFALIILSVGVFAEGELNGSLQESLQGLNGSLDTSKVQSKSNEILAKEIQVPENLKIPARVVFGLKADDPVDLQTFIVLVGIWIGCLIFMKAIVDIMPFIGDGSNARAWAGAVIITMLIAVSGGLVEVASWFLNFGQLFGVIKSWGILSTILAVVVAAIVVYVFVFVTRFIKSKSEDAKAMHKGEVLRRHEMKAEIAEGG